MLYSYESMKKYIIIAIVFLVFGCKTQKPIYITEYQTQTITEILKDTIVDVQIKEMYIENKTKDTLSELSTNNAFSRALGTNGILFHSLEQNGIQPTKIVYKDRMSITNDLETFDGYFIVDGEFYLYNNDIESLLKENIMYQDGVLPE